MNAINHLEICSKWNLEKGPEKKTGMKCNGPSLNNKIKGTTRQVTGFSGFTPWFIN